MSNVDQRLRKKLVSAPRRVFGLGWAVEVPAQISEASGTPVESARRFSATSPLVSDRRDTSGPERNDQVGLGTPAGAFSHTTGMPAFPSGPLEQSTARARHSVSKSPPPKWHWSSYLYWKGSAGTAPGSRATQRPVAGSSHPASNIYTLISETGINAPVFSHRDRGSNQDPATTSARSNHLRVRFIGRNTDGLTGLDEVHSVATRHS